MTDKITKLAPLDEEVMPEFPTLPRGGYLEDPVDEWLTKHLAEVRQIIEYQNYCVDVAAHYEGEAEAAAARVAELEAAVDPSATDSLRAELAAAEARIRELESTSMAAFPTQQDETVQASILLTQATKLGEEYIAKAKADGEQIRRDAEAELVELRSSIEELSALRFATFRSLSDFFSAELNKLHSNPLFNAETPAEEEESDEEAESVEEAPALPATVEDDDEDEVLGYETADNGDFGDDEE